MLLELIHEDGFERFNRKPSFNVDAYRKYLHFVDRFISSKNTKNFEEKVVGNPDGYFKWRLRTWELDCWLIFYYDRNIEFLHVIDGHFIKEGELTVSKKKTILNCVNLIRAKHQQEPFKFSAIF